MLGTAMGSSLINVVWALLIGAVIFAVFNVGYFDLDSEEIEKIADQLYLDDEQAKRMAERTGLEPATPGVTGRYSNQLNYRSAAEKPIAQCNLAKTWWVLQGSNL